MNSHPSGILAAHPRTRRRVLQRAGRSFWLWWAALLLAFSQNAAAQLACNAGDLTLSGVVNTYWQGTGTVASGATAVTLGTQRSAATALDTNNGLVPVTTNIAVGDLLLIVQMQDATIDTTNGSIRLFVPETRAGELERLIRDRPGALTVDLAVRADGHVSIQALRVDGRVLGG